MMYLGWYGLTGRRVSNDQLRELAAAVRAESVITMVSLASSHLAARGADDLTVHVEAAQAFLSGSSLHSTIDLLTVGAADAFIHSEQLLAAFKLAVFYGQPGAAREHDRFAVGKLFLAVSDALPDPTADDAVLAMVCRRLSFTGQEGPINLLGRYHDLLIQRAGPAFTSGRISRDPGALIKDDLRDVMARRVFAVVPYLRDVPAVRPSDPLATPAADPELHVPYFEIGPTVAAITDAAFLDTVRDQEAAARSSWMERLDGTRIELTGRDRIEINKRPIYLCENRNMVPIHIGMAMEHSSVGLYWLLHGTAGDTDPDQGVQTFTKDMGSLFEDYVDSLLTRVFPLGCRSRLFREARRESRAPGDTQDLIDEYRVGKDRKRPCDAFIVEGRNLICIEMTVGGLPMHQLVDGVGVEQLLRERLAPKYGQISRVVMDLVAGHFVLDGVDVADMRVFPVVVLLHPAPQYYTSWDILANEIRSKGWLQAPNSGVTFAPAQIITVEEWECLESSLEEGLSLAALLNRKTLDAQWRARSMKDFLMLREGWELTTGSHIDGLYERAFDNIMERIRSHVHLDDEE